MKNAAMSRFRWIAAILLLAMTVRGVILFTGQRWLRSDEAVVGLMAKHIVTRGERPLFLYGQPYGGGHAIEAYIAAPLFATFGRSAILLTAIPAIVSLVSIWLVWLIMDRFISGKAAPLAAALYAFSPPVVYQAFLVNGGMESFCLALLALFFFLKDYTSDSPKQTPALLAGVFAGLAYYAMDYALLYPICFGLLWLLRDRLRAWRPLLPFAAGLLLGALPILYYNLTTDFEHLRFLLRPGQARSMGIVHHFFSAFAGIFTGDLAAFYGGDIDDFQPPHAGAWAQAIAVILATIWLVWNRRTYSEQTPPDAGRRPLPPQMIPAVFLLVYVLLYCTARFSLPEFRTPRYFLPLCPFASMAVALCAVRFTRRAHQWIIGAVAGFLILNGAATSLGVGMRPWHFEHGVKTSGPEIAALAQTLESQGVDTTLAPYEIQWRLMFETDERIIVSDTGLSPVDRYPAYRKMFDQRVFEEHKPFAFVLRRDAAFLQAVQPMFRPAVLEKTFREAGIPAHAPAAESEFFFFFPVTEEQLRELERSAQ